MHYLKLEYRGIWCFWPWKVLENGVEITAHVSVYAWSVLDEMYQVVVYMPEDVPFNCRVCCRQRPSPWETVVRQEVYSGMKDILDALIASHSSMLLQPISHPVSTNR